MSTVSLALTRLRSKNLDRWVGGYLRHCLQRAVPTGVSGTRHLLVAVCDHFEPLWTNANGWRTVPHETGLQRVKAWEHRYPQVVNGYRDADGHWPRHTFFFPGEQYHPEFLESLARLAKRGFGEVELHLHHHDATAAQLREEIPRYLKQYAEHGHVARDSAGRLRYAFIHGDWALANGRTDGRYCGINDELPLLFETGCYADFTFPAAPDECQPRICNQIYWPVGDLQHRRPYDHGEPARVGHVKHDRILMIQGPLAFSLRWRSMPIQIENGDINHAFPPDAHRVRAWVRQGVHVRGRPEWVFIKLHTHGAPEDTSSVLLDWGSHALHRELTTHYNDGQRWQLHYVTAREMFNISVAAMEGNGGNPGYYRNHVLPPPPAADF